MPNPILDAARQRLLAIAAERAALDREERELRAMVAAAEGATSVPAPLPFPWTLGGGQTSGTITITPRYACQGGPSCGCGCNGFMWCGARLTGEPVLTIGGVSPSAGSVLLTSTGLTPDDAEMLSQGWRRCGISDTTGGPYYVKGPDLSHVTLS